MLSPIPILHWSLSCRTAIPSLVFSSPGAASCQLAPNPCMHLVRYCSCPAMLSWITVELTTMQLFGRQAYVRSNKPCMSLLFHGLRLCLYCKMNEKNYRAKVMPVKCHNGSLCKSQGSNSLGNSPTEEMQTLQAKVSRRAAKYCFTCSD